MADQRDSFFEATIAVMAMVATGFGHVRRWAGRLADLLRAVPEDPPFLRPTRAHPSRFA